MTPSSGALLQPGPSMVHGTSLVTASAYETRQCNVSDGHRMGP